MSPTRPPKTPDELLADGRAMLARRGDLSDVEILQALHRMQRCFALLPKSTRPRPGRLAATVASTLREARKTYETAIKLAVKSRPGGRFDCGGASLRIDVYGDLEICRTGRGVEHGATAAR